MDLMGGRLQRIVGAFTLFVLVVIPPTASGCSCIRSSLEIEAQRSVSIFSGRVVSKSEPDAQGYVGITFDVMQRWKGEGGAQVVVKSALSHGICGSADLFDVNRDYLVFASGDGEALFTNICNRTKRLEESHEDRSALAALFAK